MSSRLEGRIISPGKSKYRRLRPSNAVVFKSRVVVALSEGYAENVWWGDLDLTLWEQRLATLARLLERRVYLVSEADRRNAYPREPREFAIACFHQRVRRPSPSVEITTSAARAMEPCESTWTSSHPSDGRAPLPSL